MTIDLQKIVGRNSDRTLKRENLARNAKMPRAQYRRASGSLRTKKERESLMLGIRKKSIASKPAPCRAGAITKDA